MENAQKSKIVKIVTCIIIFSVLVLFLTIPAAIVGSSYEQLTDQAAEQLDKLDNSNNFTPGQQSGDSMGQRAVSAFQ